MEKKNFKNMKRGVYISLAICMLVIAGVGIFASVRSISNIVNENLDELDEISVSNDLVSDLVPYPVVKDDTSSTVPEEDKNVAVPETVYRAPVDGEVLKRFSEGELVYSKTMNDYRTHNGIDILCESGEAVVSVGAGTIKEILLDPLWGMCVSVDHGNGIVSVYKNLSETLPEGIESGAFVSDGGIIGAVSSTALVEIGEESHLHLEVFENGTAVDPIKVLKIYE